MKELTDEEIEYILDYTGMNEIMTESLCQVPVVFFHRNGNVLDFVTILSKELNTT